MTERSPIVVLDSGLGGLTVARAIRGVLPHEDVVYFGDTARLPYGSKSAATVTSFVRQIIAYLRPLDPKQIVIACNTATALSLPAIRDEHRGLPVCGVVDPGARAAIEAAGNRHSPMIGIIATEATIRSKAYERAIHRRRHHARLILQPTPLLVPLIEEGRPDADPVLRLAVEQYLSPMLRRGLEVLVLGCTHYPMLRKTIERVVGPKVVVVDSARRCAEDVARRLGDLSMLNDDMKHEGSLRCFVTDDPDRFGRLASRFLGLPVAAPTLVTLDELASEPLKVDASQPLRRSA